MRNKTKKVHLSFNTRTCRVITISTQPRKDNFNEYRWEIKYEWTYFPILILRDSLSFAHLLSDPSFALKLCRLTRLLSCPSYSFGNDWGDEVIYDSISLWLLFMSFWKGFSMGVDWGENHSASHKCKSTSVEDKYLINQCWRM